MNTIKKREIKKEMIRNNIIKAAEKIFFEKGFELSTMADLSRESKFSKRTIYMYFNSKEQIYFEIMIKGYKLLIEMLESDLESKVYNNMLEKIKKLGDIIYNFSNKYQDYFKAIIEYENGELDFQTDIQDKLIQECYELGEKILNYLINILEMGINEGSIKKELNVNKTALVLWSSTVGLFSILKKKVRYIENYHNTNSEEFVNEAFEFFIRSIKK